MANDDDKSRAVLARRRSEFWLGLIAIVGGCSLYLPAFLWREHRQDSTLPGHGLSGFVTTVSDERVALAIAGALITLAGCVAFLRGRTAIPLYAGRWRGPVLGLLTFLLSRASLFILFFVGIAALVMQIPMWGQLRHWTQDQEKHAVATAMFIGMGGLFLYFVSVFLKTFFGVFRNESDSKNPPPQQVETASENPAQGPPMTSSGGVIVLALMQIAFFIIGMVLVGMVALSFAPAVIPMSEHTERNIAATLESASSAIAAWPVLLGIAVTLASIFQFVHAFRTKKAVLWTLYFMLTMLVVGAGFVVYGLAMALAPSAPDTASGVVYNLPENRGPGVYVNVATAMTMWTAIGAMGLMIVVGILRRLRQVFAPRRAA